MIIIRPTASLAKRMKIKLQACELKSDTALGDWFALDFVLSRKQFIMCVSQKSRLAVVVNAAPYSTFTDRIQNAICDFLKVIGVTDSNIDSERLKMTPVVIAKTDDKSILGTMNDYRFQLEYNDNVGRLDLNDPLKMSMYLSKVISLVLPDGYPLDTALKLFGQELSKNQVDRFFAQPVLVKDSVKTKLYLVKS